MRRVLFTESQLKEALGEDFMSYLPNSSMAAEEPENSYGTEIGASDKNCDGIETDTITTDKIAQQTVAEINNGAWCSWVEVLSRLRERINGYEKCNKIFGTDFGCALSETWENEYNRLFSENKKEG